MFLTHMRSLLESFLGGGVGGGALCHMTCEILVPQPGIKPMPPTMEAWCLNHWIAREVPGIHFKS